jgi:hypothetical protein
LGYSDVAQGIAHWRRVGELVNALPDSPETTALALVVHVHELGAGWRLRVSERDADAHYRAGREIAERSGDLLNLLLITLRYGLVRGLSGHVRQYGELCQEANRLSLEIGDPAVRIATTLSPIYARFLLGRLPQPLALTEEGIALGAQNPTLGALEFAHQAQTGLDAEAFWLAGLSEALLAADDRSRALEVAQQAVTLARQRGSKVFLPTCYRALAEALLGSDQPGCAAHAREALQRAEAAARRTGAHAEIPLIARAGQGLALVSR